MSKQVQTHHWKARMSWNFMMQDQYRFGRVNNSKAYQEKTKMKALRKDLFTNVPFFIDFVTKLCSLAESIYL